jgi:dipeptidyl aminopeptidase/acylaminoacyl peptidase
MNAAACRVLIASLIPVSLAAAPKDTADVIFATQWFASTSLSPDGSLVAWVELQSNPDRTPNKNSVIRVRSLAGGEARRVCADPSGAVCIEKEPTWSPDGRQLAFLSSFGQGEQLQVYLEPAQGGPARRLTSLKGNVAHMKWSPDGRTLAVLNIANSTAASGAVEAAERESGEIQEKVSEARLLLIDAQSGSSRALSPADTYVYEYDWSPDAGRIAATTAKGNGDNNWWVARLQVFEVSDGSSRDLFVPATQIAVPRWSPDGASVAFIQGLMSDAGSTGGDIWIVPAGGGPARNLTAGRRSSPGWLHWQPSGRLLFTESIDGGAAVCELDPRSGAAETIWQGDQRLDCGLETELLSLSIARDGVTSAVMLSSYGRPPEIYAGPVGQWVPVTAANRSLRPLWGDARKLSWRNDGLDIQGWLLLPSHFDPAKRYPLVVSIHGGPAAQATQVWPTPNGMAQILSAEGYFVLTANPRGSFGKGEAFTAANVRDFGGGDFRDIMAGLDEVLRTQPVDPARLGVIGWSYGGYMTMWAVTQTNRFRAAVSGAGVANMQSYYGQNKIDEWMIPYFGSSVYDDPATYAKCSPITFIKNAHTPTLVVVGDSDKECPAPQSYEFWHALRTLGVETTLVVYENEGHHFRNPAHMADLLDRTVGWFDARLR